MNIKFIKDLAIGAFLVILQVVFFKHLEIFGTSADPLLFFLLWCILRHERISLLFLAAMLGLFQDALLDYWGIFMFSKTLLVFIFYGFVKKQSENRLLLWQIFLFIFSAAVIHNLIFMGLCSFIEAYSTMYYPLLFIFGNALYTAVVGVLFFIFKER